MNPDPAKPIKKPRKPRTKKADMIKKKAELEKIKESQPPKKRGRKPKPKTAADLLPKERKKRGRKPKNTVKKEEKKVNLKKRSDNVILHLPVHSEQINNDFVEDQYLTYNPEIPGSPKGVGSSKFDVYESTKADNIKMERLTSKKVEVDIDVTDIDIGDKKIIDSSGLYKKDDLNYYLFVKEFNTR